MRTEMDTAWVIGKTVESVEFYGGDSNRLRDGFAVLKFTDGSSCEFLAIPCHGMVAELDVDYKTKGESKR